MSIEATSNSPLTCFSVSSQVNFKTKLKPLIEQGMSLDVAIPMIQQQDDAERKEKEKEEKEKESSKSPAQPNLKDKEAEPSQSWTQFLSDTIKFVK